MSRKILVVEDERNIAKPLAYGLEKEGFEVRVASDGAAALAAFRKERPDLLILDVMLPGMDGFELCKAIRRESSSPILMLTARKSETDKVLGLELGADDYVTKPFSLREVVSRVKALLRRAAGAAKPATVAKAGTIEMDLERYHVRVDGHDLPLSTKEFDFLKCLLVADGRALTREDLLEKVWGYDRALDLDTRTVDQHVKRLREKLGCEAERLVTVKNVGYRLRND